MKVKITLKEGRQLGDNVIAVGYCGLQSLLNYERPIAYSAGVYGWLCDYYAFDHNGRRVVISTGYGPQGKAASYDLVKKYETIAKNLEYNRDWEQEKTARRQLIAEFIDAALNEQRGAAAND